jgi:diaminohydroxyphosphoribosylaminopyrimidine deaminase / 5-amino-6-(5-phosphoribosylamino)uracil reductase
VHENRAEDLIAQAVAVAREVDVIAPGNPRVGCVIVDDQGSIIAFGAHRGAGTAHAEVVALERAGSASHGAHLYVTLEPCRHTGRTPPCTDAVIRSGVASVTYAVADPGEHSGGGAHVLHEHGIAVTHVPHASATHLVADWLYAQHHGRPYVVGKCAISLDGRVAQSTGKPWPLTGPQANMSAHVLRSQVDAIVVGTGTVLLDDPLLTAREPGGAAHSRQPELFIVGQRAVPPEAQVHARGFHQITSRNPADAIAVLNEAGMYRVLLEGGPTILAAWQEMGFIDEIRWSISPVLMGAGPRAAAGEALRVQPVDLATIEVMHQDVVLQGEIRQ